MNLNKNLKKLRSVICMNKFLKFLGILAAIAAVAAAIYVVLQKVKAKSAPESYDEDNYVSCSCLEDDFISETSPKCTSHSALLTVAVPAISNCAFNEEKPTNNDIVAIIKANIATI